MSRFDARLELNPTEEMMRSHGLGVGGPIQKFIDNECIKLMQPYTPRLSGVLAFSSINQNCIGTGVIIQEQEYARFQYYGKVMTTEDGRVWAKKNEAKPIITDRDLVHNKSRHPKAGPHWFERMVADSKEDILKGAQEVAKKL